LLHFRNDGISNTRHQALYEERVAIVRGQFPSLDEADARLLSDRNHHTPRQLLELAGRYPEDERLTRSIRAYCEDNALHSRRAQWKASGPMDAAAWPVSRSEKQK